MPVYEFSCNACGARVSIFVRSMSSEVTGKCDRCGGTELTRLVSRFAVVKSGGDFDSLEDRLMGGFDKNNPRDMANWARNMREEMGDDWGPEMDAMVEGMQSGDGGLDDFDEGGFGDDDF